MKTIQKIALLLLSSLIFMACEDEDPIIIDPGTPDCVDTQSAFQSLFDSLISDGYTDEVTMDTEVHEYTFSLSSDEEVCKIGYQSQHEVASTPYLIEIFDQSTSSIIYSASHAFEAGATSYVEPDEKIELKAGISYTLRRIQRDWNANIGNTIGRVAWKDTMNFPYTHGLLTITGSDSYGAGGPSPNRIVPYIDLIFKD